MFLGKENYLMYHTIYSAKYVELIRLLCMYTTGFNFNDHDSHTFWMVSYFMGCRGWHIVICRSESSQRDCLICPVNEDNMQTREKRLANNEK